MPFEERESGGAEAAAETTIPENHEDGPKPSDQPDQKPEDGQLKPESPEGYDLGLAEGAQVDQELLGQFQKAAHEMGLTRGQARKLAEFYAGHTAGLGQKFEAAQAKAVGDYINTQNAAFEKRPDFKNEIVMARKAMLEFGDQALADILQRTALGSHPAMYDFMVRIGQALGEPGFKGGGGQPAEIPLHERIYGQDGLGR